MERSKAHGIRLAQALSAGAIMLALNGCSSDEPGTAAFAPACATAGVISTNSPDVPNDIGGNFFGCANNSNLRAMLDDPADLEKGRALGPASSERESAIIEDYRKGKSQPFGQSNSAPVPSITFNPSGSGSGGGQ